MIYLNYLKVKLKKNYRNIFLVLSSIDVVKGELKYDRSIYKKESEVVGVCF